MAPASNAAQEPASVAALIALMGAAFARRLNDPHTCFIDWCVGAILIAVFGGALLGVGLTMIELVKAGGLWALAAVLFVTRGNGAVIRSVSEFVRGKYGGGRGQAV